MANTTSLEPLAHSNTLLRIGEIKDRSQIPVKTIRYYEEIGLIHAVKRTEGGFRLFAPDVLKRLAFIKRAQSLGLSLQEIHDILTIHDQGQWPCHDVRQKFQTKLQNIDAEIQRLSELKHEIQTLITHENPAETSLASPNPATFCPIIEGSTIQL
jgi:MerR family transcriptional regulator, copper efflux regulator